MPVSIDKAVLKACGTHLSVDCLRPLLSYDGRVEPWQQRPWVPQGLKYLLFGSLQNEFASRCPRGSRGVSQELKDG